MDATLADNIRRKGARFREKDLNADDEYDFDGGIEMYESKKKKGTKVSHPSRSVKHNVRRVMAKPRVLHPCTSDGCRHPADCMRHNTCLSM